MASETDPRVAAARAATTEPGPRFDVLLPSKVLTAMYYEQRTIIHGLLAVLDERDRALRDRAESYSRDARTFSEMSDAISPGYYQAFADELRKLAGS